MPVNRRDFIKIVVGAGAVIAAGAAGYYYLLYPKEKPEEEVASSITVLFVGGSWKDWFETVFVKEYTDRYDISVNWDYGSGGADFRAKLIANKDRPIHDLVHTDQLSAYGWELRDCLKY